MVIVNEIPKDILDEIAEVFGDKEKNIKEIRLNCSDNIKYEKLGRGAFGAVFNVRGYAVKVFVRDYNDVDYEKLEKLQGLSLFPTLYAYEPNTFMVCELIKGKLLKDLSYEEAIKISPSWKLSIREAFDTFDKNALYPDDIHSENVMMVESGEIKVVDVGNFEYRDKQFVRESGIYNYFTKELRASFSRLDYCGTNGKFILPELPAFPLQFKEAKVGDTVECTNSYIDYYRNIA